MIQNNQNINDLITKQLDSIDILVLIEYVYIFIMLFI